MQSETAFPSSFSGAAAGFEELSSGIRHWRVSHLIGIRELRHRYARSKLGQFWLILSNASMIGIMVAVWSLLWNQPVRELAPYMGVSVIIWNYLSQVLIDCTTIFGIQAHLYRNQKMNFSVSIYSVIYKNTIMLAHSLIIIIVLIVIFDVPVNRNLLTDSASIRTHFDWIGVVGIPYRHDMRTLSRCRSSHHYLVHGPILYHTGDVEAGFPSAPVSFNHRIEPICPVLGDYAQPVLGPAGQFLCVAKHHSVRPWRRPRRTCCNRPL